MKGLEQEYSSFVCMILCLFTVGFFFLLITMPPIVAAAGYTAMVIVMYRICYGTFSQIGLNTSEFTGFFVAFACAVIWPLYFFFGACVFLNKMVRGE